MSNYIIPDGWNPMTEKWKEGRFINVIHKDGTIWCTQNSPNLVNEAVAWQYPVPLEKKRRYVVRQSLCSVNKWNVWDDSDCACALNFKSKEHAEAFAKYLEENEP